ncbi:uncharacterized protein K02A2.6-like [Amyelois transitella]|uniref:uncharacterized protein K02A2.6-like n=1 Tax=Amyelois transitella TaxID=680683 RepID=UPI00298FCBFD|nr:uncharacterized protein K02A2.6-like [Amyelois transitella]
MEETLRGVPNTVVFLDDIAVTGATRAIHLCNLRQVLKRLKDMGLTVKIEKCKFLQNSVKYLGYIIDKTGLHPDPKKVDAIANAPRPADVTQLKSFLGILNYYGKFIPNLSIMLHPLLKLLKKDVLWEWSTECESAFNEAKQALLSDRVLAHYEEGRPLVLSVDSSAYGVGAVLAHALPDGERPVSCASRTLNQAEKHYSQLDKEALAIFFGGIPQTAASRLQRWAVRLAAYDFKVEFIRSSENGPADALSRLPLSRLDNDLENVCRTCEACRAVRDAPPHARMHPWEYPLVPWQRIHADFGDCAGTRYLIIVDAHSKWIEAIPMTRTDAQATISAFRTVFARFGLPAQLVTDNGPPFFSLEFKSFCSLNCIKHVTSAPYRPQGNGAAENAVKTVKKAIKRALHEGESVEKALNVFLFSYRNCEHATTGVPPAVLMLGRRLRSRLDALRPDLSSVVRAAQQRQVTNAGGTTRAMNIGEPVLVRNYSVKGNRWEKGSISEKTGPVSYKVSLDNGLQWRRHHDQILPVKDKSRFSLAQAKLSSSREKEDVGREDADESEDAADVGDVGVDEGDARRVTVQPPNEGDSKSPTSPGANASARALRAFKRANKK